MQQAQKVEFLQSRITVLERQQAVLAHKERKALERIAELTELNMDIYTRLTEIKKLKASKASSITILS